MSVSHLLRTVKASSFTQTNILQHMQKRETWSTSSQQTLQGQRQYNTGRATVYILLLTRYDNTAHSKHQTVFHGKLTVTQLV